MNIPVVFIHLNESKYAVDIFSNASYRNDVYVISNIDYSNFVSSIKAINISTLQTASVKHFSDSYKHLHSGPYSHELFCYQRWFFLLQFMIQHNFETILHLDSDIILNTDASKDHDNYKQYIMTLAHGSSGATSYITKEGLSLFIDMLMDVYSGPSYTFDLLECQYQNMIKHNRPGGICDMTLLNLFRERCDYGGGPNRVGEMMQILDGCTHDHNINVDDSDYEMHNRIKNIHISDGRIFCKNLRLDKLIEFKSLHCQGEAKYHIKNICSELLK